MTLDQLFPIGVASCSISYCEIFKDINCISICNCISNCDSSAYQYYTLSVCYI